MCSSDPVLFHSIPLFLHRQSVLSDHFLHIFSLFISQSSQSVSQASRYVPGTRPAFCQIMPSRSAI
jgi:hypothetical protein